MSTHHNQVTTPNTFTAQHIPLLDVLRKDNPVRCDGRGALAYDDLADLVRLLFHNIHVTDEYKATRFLEFLLKLEAVLLSDDKQEQAKLEVVFQSGKEALFKETMFYNNALAVFAAQSLKDSRLHWNDGNYERREPRQAYLNRDTRRLELSPVANREAQPEAVS